MWGAAIEGITKLQAEELRNSDFQLWLLSPRHGRQDRRGSKPSGETATEISGIFYCDGGRERWRERTLWNGKRTESERSGLLSAYVESEGKRQMSQMAS